MRYELIIGLFVFMLSLVILLLSLKVIISVYRYGKIIADWKEDIQDNKKYGYDYSNLKHGYDYYNKYKI